MATILIVDDRPVNRELLVTLLTYTGHHPLEAADGEEGLVLARAEHPDLIITDIVMPKMDGYEFARQVRADPSISNTQIIFYTSSYIVSETRRLAEACGVSIVIGKPIEPAEFLEQVRIALAIKPAPIVAPASDEFHREHMRMLTDTLVKKVDELEAEIAERIQAQNDLRYSEELFRTAFQYSPVGMCIITLDGRLQNVNQPLADMLGFAITELEGKHFNDITHAEDLEIGRNAYGRMLLGEMPSASFEKRYLHKNGRVVWVYISSALLKDSSGKPLHFITHIIDITGRKRAEEKIHIQNQRLKVLREIDVAILAADSVENIVGAALGHIRELIDCRRANLTLIDQGTKELVIFDARTAGETSIPAGNRLPLVQFEDIIQTLSQNQPILFSDLRTVVDPMPGIQRLLKDGLLSTCSLPLFSQGNLIGMFSMHSEIPGFFEEEKIALGREVANQVAIAITQNRLLATLRESEQLFTEIFMSSPIAISMASLPGGKNIEVNDSWCKLTGFSREEAIGFDTEELKIFDREERNKLIEEFTKQGRTTLFESRLVTKGGQKRDILISSEIIMIKGVQHILTSVIDITERKLAEQALRETEERFRQVWESTSDAMCISDATGIILDANPASLRLYGYTPEQIIGQSITVTVPEETREQLMEQYAAVFLSDFIPPTFETVARHADGTDRIVESSITFLTNATGERIAILSTFHDITERKQAEHALLESEEKFRNLIEHLPTVVYMNAVGDATTTVYVSPQIQTMLGYTPVEWLADPKLWSKRLHPEDRQRVLEEAAAFDRNLKPLEMEYRMNARDDRTIWVHDKVVLVNDLKGQAQFWQGIMLDITERRQAEEEQVKSEKKFSDAFHSSPAAMTITRIANGTFIDANEAFLNIFEFTGDEVIGHTSIELNLLGPEARRLLIERQLATGGLQNAELEAQSKSGRTITILFSSSTIDINNETHHLTTMIDITERKRAEEQILRQLDYLTALQDIDRTIAAAFNMHPSLNALISKAVSLLKVDAVAILLLNDSEKTLDFAAGDGFRTNAINIGSINLEKSYAGRAAMKQQMVKIPNLQDEQTDLFIPGFLKGEDFVSYYGVPLIVTGKTVGVMEVFQRSLIKRDQEWLDFLNALAGQAAIAISNAQLFDSLQQSNKELMRAYDATIEGWSAALDLRDKETEGHSQRVTEMTVKLARSMGSGESEIVQIRRGALLHDIGKLGIPDNILLKPGKLTDEEWVIMRKHPTFAYEMLVSVEYLKPALDIPYCHHEKWDGTGYPRGLKGEEIPLEARIFAIVDVWDALRSDRPYRAGWPQEKVLAYLHDEAGKHFDPEVVKAFLNLTADN